MIVDEMLLLISGIILPAVASSLTSSLRRYSASSGYFVNDPIFSEYAAKGNETLEGFTEFDFMRGKRGALELGQIIKCATGCNPLSYKGYGCYCGFLGSGETVDGIDRCCKMHDWCYTTTTCMNLDYHLPYFVGFKWKCNRGAPYCLAGKTKSTDRSSCGHQLCECDREFAMCLQKYPCPKTKAVCKSSPFRLFQNLFMSPVGHSNGGHHHGHQRPRGGRGNLLTNLFRG